MRARGELVDEEPPVRCKEELDAEDADEVERVEDGPGDFVRTIFVER